MESFRNMMQSTGGRVFLAIVLVIFVLFAFGTSFMTPPGAQGEIAVVNDHRIMERELQSAYEETLARYGNQIDRKTLEKMIKRDDVLNELIRQRVMIDAAREEGLVADPALVQQTIMEIPNFRDESGKFSPELFQQLVMRNGYANAAAFRTRIEEDLLRQQVMGAFSDSSFTTRQDLEMLTRMGEQKRDIGWAVFAPVVFASQVQVAPDEAQKRYDGNPAGYMSEEQFAIEYVEVNLADYAASQKIDEKEIQAKYQEMVTQAQQNAERRVAHILVGIKDGNDAAAKARAEEALAKLTAGQPFPAVAAQYSEDDSTKAQGGDLGFISRGVLENALDAAAFALKQGDVSAPVKGEDGYHLLKVLETREVAVPAMAEARAGIVAGLGRDLARGRYDEIVAELGTQTYESDTLEEPAKKLGLQVRRTGLFGRNGGPGVVSNPKVLEEVLSDSVLLDARNSDVISPAEGQAVVVRLLEHRKPARRPFTEVAGEIVAEIRQEKAAALAAEKAKALVDAVNAGTPLAQAAQQAGVTVQQSVGVSRREQQVPRELVEAAFRLKRPAAGANSVGTADLLGGSKAVLVVSNVVDGSLLGADPTRVASDRGSLAGEFGNRDMQRWTDLAEANADVVRVHLGEEGGLLDALKKFKESFKRP